MKAIVLQAPPNPAGMDAATWQQQAYSWMNDTKGKIESMGRINFAPAGQAFSLGTFALTTSLTGTDSTSNFLCSVVQAMIAKGVLKPV